MAHMAFFTNAQHIPHTLRKRGVFACGKQASPHLIKCGSVTLFSAKAAFYKDSRYTVVCDSALVEKKALREALIGHGIHVNTSNDARLLCHAFACFGEEMTGKIAGTYAFLVWDSQTGALYGMCDRAGSRALYYRLTPDSICVATDPALIAPMADSERKKALRSVLRGYLTLGYMAGESVGYSEVQRLPVGHRFWWHKGKFSMQKWADYTFLGASLESGSRMENALKAALLSPPPSAALLLTGSVPSSLMAALGRKERAVAISFEGDIPSAIPARVAQLFGMSLEVMTFTSADCLCAAQALAKESPLPIADPAALSYFLLAGHASSSIACAEGAAELFGGHLDYYAYPKGPACALKMMKAGWVSSILSPFQPSKKEKSSYKLGRTAAFSDAEALSLLAPAYRCAIPAKENLRHFFCRCESAQVIDCRQYTDLFTYLPDDRLLAIAQASQAYSISFYLPYLQQECIGAALSLPTCDRIAQSQSMPVFRTAAAHYLPYDVTQSVLELPLPPIGRYLKWDLFSGAMREVFSDPITAHFFDRHLLLSMLESHRCGAANHARKLWCAYLFLLWYAAH